MGYYSKYGYISEVNGRTMCFATEAECAEYLNDISEVSENEAHD